MATKTGNKYTTETATDRVEIPTASPGFSTMAARIKCHQVITTMNDNRKWQCGPQTGNTYISGTTTDRMTVPTANLGFSTTPIRKKLSRVIAAATSDCRSLSESPRYTSCEFAMVECRGFAVGILMIYVVVSEILVRPVSWLPSSIFDTM